MTRIWPGARVGAQEPAVDVEVERVPQVPRRVVGRDVEHLEVGDVVLDLRALVDDEPELGEHVGDLAGGLGDRVEGAAADRPAGRRDVGGLGGEPGRELGAAETRSSLGQRGLDGRADLVRDGADLRAILGGQRADPAQDRRELALLAQDLDLLDVERRRVRRAGGRRDGARPQRLEVGGQLGEIHRACVSLALWSGNHEPSSVNDVEGPTRWPGALGASGDLGDPAEGRGVADGEVGEDLAVEVDVGLPEAGDEPAVGDPVQAGGRVDPDDPQLAHVALALLPVARRVGERVELRLAGPLDELAVRAHPPFGGVEQPLVALVGRDAPLDACHRMLLERSAGAGGAAPGAGVPRPPCPRSGGSGART